VNAVGITNLQNRARHKRTKKHKDYENNQIISPKSERITCPCGGRYTWNNKSRHCSTLLHKNYLSKLEEKSESDKDGYDSESDAHSFTSIESFEKRYFSGYYRYLIYTGDDCD
jgi:hypothetical protein